MNISDDIKLYQINDNGKLILAIDFNKYNELFNKYNNIQHELDLIVKIKDDDKNLLREYEHKLKDKKEIEKIKRDKKNIETEYDQLEEKYIRNKMELERIQNTLNQFKSLLF